jgi:hypothetical protein
MIKKANPALLAKLAAITKRIKAVNRETAKRKAALHREFCKVLRSSV